MLDAPILSKKKIDEYILFVDSIVKTTLPNFQFDTSLFNLVTTYQTHSDCRSGGKYKNQTSRYHFGKFFISKQ